MKTRNILSVVLLLLSLQGLHAQSKSGKQDIRVSERCVDFGQVSRKGTPPSRTIYICNEGEQPLIITHTSTTCKCIKSRYSKRPITPRDSIPFKISYQAIRGEKGH
ncbi:MAG: DUF1573 domain-containing protein, partial [Rikenellaceae bacterium]